MIYIKLSWFWNNKKNIAKVCIAKRECSVEEAVYLPMPKLWLRKVFPKIKLLNSNLPGSCYRVFHTAEKISGLPEESINIFHKNMLDLYMLIGQIWTFRMKNIVYFRQMCFLEFLSHCHVAPKSLRLFESDSQPVELDDEHTETNRSKC